MQHFFHKSNCKANQQNLSEENNNEYWRLIKSVSLVAFQAKQALKHIDNGRGLCLDQVPLPKTFITLKVLTIGLIYKFISTCSQLQVQLKFFSVFVFLLKASELDTSRTCPSCSGKDVVPVLHVIKRHFKIQLHFTASFPLLVLTVIAALKQCW